VSTRGKGVGKLAVVLALKEKASRAKSRVITRREAQGKSNERGGAQRLGASEPPLTTSNSGSKRGIATSFRMFWKSKSKSSGGSASPTFTSNEPKFTALPAATPAAPVVPKLKTATLSPVQPPATAAASSGASQSAAPLNASAAPSDFSGTPRPGHVPQGAAATTAGTAAKDAPAHLGTPRVLPTETAAGSPGTPRPGHVPDAGSNGHAGGLVGAPTPVPQPPLAEGTETAPSAEGVVESTAVGSTAVGGTTVDDVQLEGDFADEDIPVEISAEQSAVVDGHVAHMKSDMLRALGVVAAKWLLSRELLPPEATQLQLENMIGAAITIKSEEVANGRLPVFGAVEDEEACVACWRQRVSQLLTELRSPASCAEAETIGEPWARAVMEAKREVMDPNKERLTDHLENMWTEHMTPAKAELSGSRLRTVMKAKALRVHQTLKGAMDDVERQFRQGMTPFAMQRLEREGELSEDQMANLCTAAVKYFREGFDRPWAIATLEKELEACMAKEEQVVSRGPSASMGDDPVGWLLGLVLGAAELPLALDVREWLASAIATYLDPFIDGEVPAPEYHSRSEGFVMARLRKAWAADREIRGLEPTEMPVTPLCALAQYATHAICKLNANLGFGPHQAGVGRNQISQRETEVYLKKLGDALVAGINRDFPKSEQAFGSLPCLTSGQIMHVGQLHLKGVVLYQQELANALAIANRDGEEARREERLRIWGYA